MSMPSHNGLIDALHTAEWIATKTPIRLFGDTALCSVAAEVAPDEFGSEEINSLQSLLSDTLTNYRKQTGLGRGLAANQVGHLKRLVAVAFDTECSVLYNPKVLTTKGSASYHECCLSSGMLLTGEVIRPATGTFEYQSADGTLQTLEANPAQTRLLLHEIDHLNGITCDQKYEAGTQRFVRDGKTEILAEKLTIISEA